MKETKELVIAFLEIASLLAVEFKDGIQANDFADLYSKISSNEDLKSKLIAAYNDIDKIPAEIKDLTIPESLDLLMAAAPELIGLFKAIKA